MEAKQLKNSAIYNVLKKDKKAQEAFLRIGKTKDWIVIRQFVGNLKQVLLEGAINADDLLEIKRFKHLIYGIESLVLCPGLVGFIKEMEKENKFSKEEKEREAKRRKFNPGVYIKNIAKKVRGR